MYIEFLKPGMQTSLQDVGYSGQMQNGIAASGAMDPIAMELANWLVSKPKNSAVLEMTLIGPKLKFSKAMQIAICGANFDCLLNGILINNNETIKIQAGDILELTKLKFGARAYLAFTGTPKLEKILDSYATNICAGYGFNSGQSFKAGDKLLLNDGSLSADKKLPQSLQPIYSNHIQLRVTAGIEQSLFTDDNVSLFYTQTYQLTRNINRMGLRLQSKPLTINKIHSLTSSCISQGTIQIPANGQPIITSVEGQTIGGYPRIANLIKADLHLLGQLKVHDRVNFMEVDVDYAQQLWKQKVDLYRQL